MKTLKVREGYALFILLATVLFTSCCKLNDGYVVRKIYEPARTYITVEYDVVLKMTMPKTKYDDEDWYLVIEGVVDQDTLTREISVTRKEFERHNVGDYVKLD